MAGGRERNTDTPQEERNCWRASHLNACFGQLGQGHGNNHRLDGVCSRGAVMCSSVNALETVASVGEESDPVCMRDCRGFVQGVDDASVSSRPGGGVCTALIVTRAIRVVDVMLRI